MEKISDENFSTVARGNEKLSDQLQEDEEEKGEKETPDLSRDKEGFRWMSFSDAMYKASKNTYSERLGRMPLDTVVVRKAYRKKQVFVECTQEESEAYARSTTAND